MISIRLPKVLLVMAAICAAPGAARAQSMDGDAHARGVEDLERWRRQQRRSAEDVRDGSSSLASPAHRHLGFYLRLDLGLGTMAASTTADAVPKAKDSGTAGSFGVHLGGAVKENVIVAFHVFDSVALDPKREQGGSSTTLEDTTLLLMGYGLELTWYLMPANVYVSLSPALTQITVSDKDETTRSKLGFGGRVAVGWEWWVSSHWGLGLCANGTWSRNTWKEPIVNGKTDAWAWALALSGTYN